jgi:hypothetical protein
MDDTPAGEFSDSEGAARVTVSNDATIVKVGSNSLEILFDATAQVEDGVQYTAGQPYNFTADENVGLWIYSTIALDAADIAVELQDDGGERVISLGAVAATTWEWESLALPGADGDKDAISEMRIVQKVDKGAMTIYLDTFWKWDDATDEDITNDILDDGDISVLVDIIAGGAWSNLVQQTDYFIDYSSTDHIVYVSDQSANKVVLFYAYEDHSKDH